MFLLQAYIDPGTGSQLLQILAAMFFGAVFALKMGWIHVRTFFGRLFSRSSDSFDDE